MSSDGARVTMFEPFPQGCRGRVRRLVVLDPMGRTVAVCMGPEERPTNTVWPF